MLHYVHQVDSNCVILLFGAEQVIHSGCVRAFTELFSVTLENIGLTVKWVLHPFRIALCTPGKQIEIKINSVPEEAYTYTQNILPLCILITYHRSM